MQVRINPKCKLEFSFDKKKRDSVARFEVCVYGAQAKLYSYRNEFYDIHPSFTVDFPMWGCGVRAVVGPFGAMLQYPALWEMKEFREQFESVFSTPHPWENGGAEMLPTGSIIACLTTAQMNRPYTKESIAVLKKHYVVHEIGSFPNYTHSPNCMVFLVINIHPHTKQMYPVAWDLEAQNAKKQAQQQAQEARFAVPVPSGSVISVQRDSRGRFTKLGR